MTFGSLFAGIGGFDLGFERAGMQCVWQVERDRQCLELLAQKFSPLPIVEAVWRSFAIRPVSCGAISKSKKASQDLSEKYGG